MYTLNADIYKSVDKGKNIWAKIWKISLNECFVIEYSSNIWAKGEINHYELFVDLLQCFQKLSAAD